MRYPVIPPALFKDRRQAFVRKMEPGSLAIFFSNDHVTRTADQHFPFRQDSSFFAMCGIDQPGSALIINPAAKQKPNREILFILPEDPLHAIWNGERLTSRQASKISGVDHVRMIDDFEKTLQETTKKVNTIYVNHPDEPTTKRVRKIVGQHVKDAIISSKSIMEKVRMIKHPVEIDLVRQAIDVTAKAFDRVLRTISPGQKEFEVEAELTYVISKSGCRHAFEPIVASGQSACILHYITNDRVIKDGSLILLDFGVEYANLNSDMTRTIPANGRFSKEQKKVYLSVLHVLDEVMSMMKPGVTLDELNKETGGLIEGELMKLKIISKNEIKRQDKKTPLWKKYFMHGVSHHLGYDVHDLSDRQAPLKPGMLLTCEPGIYLPSRGIGIRLENDVLITRKGCENLMKTVPIHPDEIESLMSIKT